MMNFGFVVILAYQGALQSDEVGFVVTLAYWRALQSDEVCFILPWLTGKPYRLVKLLLVY